MSLNQRLLIVFILLADDAVRIAFSGFSQQSSIFYTHKHVEHIEKYFGLAI